MKRMFIWLVLTSCRTVRERTVVWPIVTSYRSHSTTGWKGNDVTDWQRAAEENERLGDAGGGCCARNVASAEFINRTFHIEGMAMFKNDRIGSLLQANWQHERSWWDPPFFLNPGWNCSELFPINTVMFVWKRGLIECFSLQNWCDVNWNFFLLLLSLFYFYWCDPGRNSLRFCDNQEQILLLLPWPLYRVLATRGTSCAPVVVTHGNKMSHKLN